ncbi:MAG: ATP-binding protein [Desulfobacterales bacterium]|nr:ATP-binding protein [Desulfobacterales bacterium]
MRELSLHILDIAENGITAGADCVHITVDEARDDNRMTIIVTDNGPGIPKEMIETVTDPFVTSRTTRRVGLGLSLLAAAAKRCNGDFTIDSAQGKGTSVTATFVFDHIDRAPVGNMAATITTLMAGNPDTEFAYIHQINKNDFSLDTREIKRELEGVLLNEPAVIHHLTELIRKELKKLEPKNEETYVKEK